MIIYISTNTRRVWQDGNDVFPLFSFLPLLLNEDTQAYLCSSKRRSNVVFGWKMLSTLFRDDGTVRVDYDLRDLRDGEQSG